MCFSDPCAQSDAMGARTEVKMCGGRSTGQDVYNQSKTVKLKGDWRGASGSFEVMQLI